MFGQAQHDLFEPEDGFKRKEGGGGTFWNRSASFFRSATMSAAATGEVGVCSGSAEASAVPAHEGRGLDEGLGEGGAEQARSRQHPDEWRRGGIII